jgi:hypothetical protein
MGRRALADPHRRVNVYIEQALLDKFALIHFDPARGGAAYGKLSEKLNELLRKDLLIHDVKLPEED